MSRFKVDFMIIGAQKSGTTSLADMLKSHSDLVCCRQKEPQFFSGTQDWRKELSTYEDMFPRQVGAKYFEASTGYTMYPRFNYEIWEDLYEYNSKLKFLYIVRAPLQRVISHYVHSYERGYTDDGIESAIFQLATFVNNTRYHFQISPFIERFGKDQVKICFLEDLKSDPLKVRSEIANFLEIDGGRFPDEVPKSNVAGEIRRLHKKWDNPSFLMKCFRKAVPPAYKWLTGNSGRQFRSKPVLSVGGQKAYLKLLEDDLQKFELLCSRDLSHWRKITR